MFPDVLQLLLLRDEMCNDFIDSHQIVVSEQPPDLKPIFSFSLDGVVPRQGLVSVVEVDPKGEERVGGKRSENSRD